MENDNNLTFINDLKQHLEDHDGELVYWGAPLLIPLPTRERVPPSVIREPVSAGETVPSPSGGGTGRGQSSNLNKSQSLEDLRINTIGDCHLCPLGNTRIKIAFGVGNPETDVMFVGEGPGFDEDRQGVPFVGKAGQLLDKIMAAIELDRTKVYIANVVKCHPMVDPSQPDKRGNDRPPAPDEIEKCRPFLIEQIRVIRPKIIVTLGGTASKAVLQTSKGITAIRGQVFDTQLADDLEPIRVMPTFHPAALLRDPELKRPVWEDMKKLKALLAETR